MKPKWDSWNQDKKDVMMETGVMNAGSSQAELACPWTSTSVIT
jgi:hypothetical protein